VDTISSNSYLVQTPDVILLIDPGGLAAQAEELALAISGCRQELDRPVFVVLTHVHIDHFIGVQSVPAFAHSHAVVFAVQEAGALALESGDTRITQSRFFNTPVSPMTIGLHLVTEDRSQVKGACSLAFPNGAEVTIARDVYQAGSSTVPVEQIRFGPGPSLGVYHTPGHSPDSICIRIGESLFIGDLLFAANPGIAGISGWSQEALLVSLDAMVRLIGSGGIRVVYPGHGRPLPAADAARMLAAARKEAQELTGIAELNTERAARTAAYADDCMEQVNELFTIMAGRLQYAAYVMDELGEAGMAGEAGSLIRNETIDELLDAFRAFSEEHHRGGIVPIHLVLKAGQVIARLERTFNRDQLAGILDPTVVERACRLLSDYTVMLRGFNPPRQIAEHDLASLAAAVVTGLSRPQLPDEAVFSSLDDGESFSRMLLSRIGSRPLLEEVRTSIQADATPRMAWVDRDHCIDLFTYILEDLAGTGATEITLRLQQDSGRAVVVIEGTVPATGQAARQERRTWRFLQGLAERAGGTLAHSGTGDRQTFRFDAPAADPAVTPA
jgi:glyoxylase-like metal-dependent hydrolase (beta-lactamase superfamily II)